MLLGDVAYTVVELETRIRTIENAWATGLSEVRFADRSVVYADDYEQRLRYFKGLLIELQGGRPRQTLGVASKGF